jgi:hypothetical protein
MSDYTRHSLGFAMAHAGGRMSLQIKVGMLEASVTLSTAECDSLIEAMLAERKRLPPAPAPDLIEVEDHPLLPVDPLAIAAE